MIKYALVLLGGAAVGVGATYYFGRRAARLACKAGLLGAALPASAIATHLRQIRRYAFAASQDMSPVVGLTHASYALVLLDTLEEVVGKETAAKVGINTTQLREFITKHQDRHAEALQTCDPHLQQVLAVERGEGSRLPGHVVAGAGFAAPRGA